MSQQSISLVVTNGVRIEYYSNTILCFRVFRTKEIVRCLHEHDIDLMLLTLSSNKLFSLHSDLSDLPYGKDT